MSASENRIEVRLKRNATHRCLAGHPWIFANELEPIVGAAPGAEVAVIDWHGRFIGIGYWNPASKIAVRLVSRSEHDSLNVDFFMGRMREARALRDRILPADEPMRLVFSESDRLPGLIADRYGDVIVMQLLTLGMELRRAELIEALTAVYRPSGIHERSDASSRAKENLPARIETAFGSVPERIECRTDGIAFVVNPTAGHKTGAYLDQRMNRRAFGARAAGRKALDVFAYHGHFGLYAAAGGALETICIESSADAAKRIAENAELNGFAIEAICGNAFDLLKDFDAGGRRFGLISLDPPAFASKASDVKGAARGMKELALRALKMLEPDGVLFASSCSFHAGREELLHALASAAYDSGRDVQLLEIAGASPDHPVRMEIPETDYLKCAVLRVS